VEMASLGTVTVRYELRNRKAVESLLQSCEAVSRIVEEQPWNEDAKEAKRALRRAIRELVPRSVRD
jgi:hypothetical protein